MMDREYLVDKIDKLIHAPWITEGDLMSLYTILVALPISDGSVSYMLADTAQQIDENLKHIYVREDTDDADKTTRARTTPPI